MAVEAPLSKHKRNTHLIWMAVLAGFAIVFAYDGYLSKYKWSMRYSFYEKHVLKNDGKPDDTMIWNRKWLPIICGGAAVILAAHLLAVRNKKLIADDNELILSAKVRIPYDSIQKIDKTRFESKGRFTITYTDAADSEQNLTLNDRNYDNLGKILDLLVEKIT